MKNIVVILVRSRNSGSRTRFYFIFISVTLLFAGMVVAAARLDQLYQVK
jgi:general stress protein CsbA